MITRIEIDGFKTFTEFSVDLAPFQVIIGPNGSGKSNLFDALRLLARLADMDLPSAFQDMRGQTHELFTIRPDGQIAERMTLAVEMLVDSTVKDDWGEQVELKSPRLRYVVDIGRRKNALGMEQLFILGESLQAIPQSSDTWGEKHLSVADKRRVHKSGNEALQFISTAPGEPGSRTVYLMPERSKSKRRQMDVGYATGKIERTLLSRVDSTEEFPHVFAARQEMRRWSFLDLDIEALRRPSLLVESFDGVLGNYVPFLLNRLNTEDPALLCDVSRDMGNLVSGIREIEVIYDELRKQYDVFVNTQDGRRFFLPALSDGTLRMLALATLRNDPNRRGVLCVEEPENGVHPGALKRLVRLMRDMTTDLFEPEQLEKPVLQLLVTTHSPELVSELEVPNELLFAELVTRAEPGKPPMQVTRMTPVCRDMEGNKAAKTYTLTKVLQYLNYADHDAVRTKLKRASA